MTTELRPDGNDEYISRKVSEFFALTGRFGTEADEKITEALDTIINAVYHDGFQDGSDYNSSQK